MSWLHPIHTNTYAISKMSNNKLIWSNFQNSNFNLPRKYNKKFKIRDKNNNFFYSYFKNFLISLAIYSRKFFFSSFIINK